MMSNSSEFRITDPTVLLIITLVTIGIVAGIIYLLYREKHETGSFINAETELLRWANRLSS